MAQILDTVPVSDTLAHPVPGISAAHMRYLWTSAIRRPPCLPDRWPSLDSHRQERRQLRPSYSFRLANRQSSWAARRGIPRTRQAVRWGLLATSESPLAPQRAADQARVRAISEVAHVRATAASRAFALEVRQTQTQHREQRAKASSESTQLNITSHCRYPLIGNFQDKAKMAGLRPGLYTTKSTGLKTGHYKKIRGARRCRQRPCRRRCTW